MIGAINETAPVSVEAINRACDRLGLKKFDPMTFQLTPPVKRGKAATCKAAFAKWRARNP